MPNLDSGQPFSSNEALTNVKIHDLFDKTEIDEFVRADFGSSASPVHIAATAPTANPVPIAGNTWFDTVNALLRIYDGANWNPWARGWSYTNRSGGTLSAGAVVVLDTANASSVKTTTTANNEDVFGVILVGGADATQVIVATEGRVPAVNVTGATAIGDFLTTSTTAGSAVKSTAFSKGSFAKALSSTAGSGSVIIQLGGGAIAGNAAGFNWNAIDVVSFARNANASGVQTISHSLGVKPKLIKVMMGVTGRTNCHPVGYCLVIDGTVTSQHFSSVGDGGNGILTSNSSCFFGPTIANTDYNKGTITDVSTTDIDVTWAVTGSPGANSISGQIILMA